MAIMSRLLQATAAIAVVAAPVGFALRPASAQGVSSSEVRTLNDQVGQVQRELNVLQRHVYQDVGTQGSGTELAQAGPGGNFADMQVRIEEIESSLRQMNGRMEEINHRVTVLNDRLDKFSSDLEFRLNSAQPSAGGTVAPQDQDPAQIPITPPALAATSPAPQLTPPPGSGDPNRAPSQSGVLGTLSPGDAQSASPAAQASPDAGNPLPSGSPEEQYKYAFSLLTKSDYPGAERALHAFLAAHPTHQLAGNAQYWLGESYYVRNDFNNAARAFAIGFQKYPKSAKGPDNLLKLGLSLAALKKTKEACQSYGMLKSEFPKAPQEVMRRAAAEQKHLRCG